LKVNNILYYLRIFRAFLSNYFKNLQILVHCTTKNILGIAHPKHSILLLVSRILERDSGYFALLVASNQIYSSQEMISSN
jgi:hypothetical protein